MPTHRGRVLFEAKGDRLDVIGHFHDPAHQPPHTDWLDTGSRFALPQFEQLWTAVSQLVASS